MPATKNAALLTPRFGAETKARETGRARVSQPSMLLQLLRDPRVIALWRFRYRSRVELLALSDEQLEDVGLTRAAAEAEAAKPFWRA